MFIQNQYTRAFKLRSTPTGYQARRQLCRLCMLVLCRTVDWRHVAQQWRKCQTVGNQVTSNRIFNCLQINTVAAGIRICTRSSDCATALWINMITRTVFVCFESQVWYRWYVYIPLISNNRTDRYFNGNNQELVYRPSTFRLIPSKADIYLTMPKWYTAVLAGACGLVKNVSQRLY